MGWRDEDLDRIIGRKLVSIESTKEEIVLNLDGGATCTIKAEGDCCSESWFEHVDDNDATGGDVTEIDNAIEDATELKAKDHECLLSSFLTIKTTTGRLHVELRNSSNGYYSGYLTVSLGGFDV